MQRRDLLVGAAATGSLSALGFTSAPPGRAAEGGAPDPAAVAGPVHSGARRPAQGLLPKRIAFGSCVRQDKPQPIWDAVNALEPELFVFLGDNVYGDTRDMGVLRAKYAQLAAQPGFRRLCERTAVLATWDDHDYGEDDAGADYPLKRESQRIFCDFWGEPADSLRRSRDGIYDSVTLAAGDRRLQILLPDLRFNRTPIRRLDLGGRSYRDWSKALADAGREVPGPYERNPDAVATMLGADQWRWLEAELAKPADLRILASSLQVVADFPGWEAWINYADDHQRLIETIRRTRADGLICISGDTHYAELSRLDRNVPYTLWDLTSSGLTEVWPVTPPNSRRLGPVLRARNFGWIEIDWPPRTPQVTLQIRTETGEPWLTQRLDPATLRVS
jgi:alkaline phosphatase D